MKKTLIITACIMFCASTAWGDSDYAYYYSHPVPSDYTYRTERISDPPQEKKSAWDYLSFFALPKPPKHHVAAEEANELKMRVRELGQQLLLNSKESIAEEYVVTVSSFVNLNNLYQVSAFGRYFGEQLIGEMQLAGVEVIDVRKTNGIMIHEGKGEYGLSRNMGELSYIHSAHATVVGTYTYSNGQVLVNARLLNNSDGMVLSQANVVFELDPLTEGFLADEGAPPRQGSVVSIQSYE